LLREIKTEIQSEIHIKDIDVTKSDAQEKLNKFIREMEGVDLIVISAGIGDFAVNWETNN